MLSSAYSGIPAKNPYLKMLPELQEERRHEHAGRFV